MSDKFFHMLQEPHVKVGKEIVPSNFFSLGKVNKKYTNKIPLNIDPNLRFDEHTILFIHKKILEKLENRIRLVENLKHELVIMIDILKSPISPIDQVLALHKITKLRESLKGIETAIELLRYKCATKRIIKQYKALSQREVKSFITTTTEEQEVQLSKEKLAIEFLCIAHEYINIEGFIQKRNGTICKKCGIVMEYLDSDYICRGCGREVKILDFTPSFKDISRVSTASKYEYIKDGHFNKALKEFQGTHAVNKKSLKNAEKLLREEMSRNNLDEETVTKDHLYKFLEDLQLSDNYVDIHLLYANITGIPCIDLSKWNDEIRSLFYKQELAYNAVKNEERDNSLIVNYKLLKVLQKLDYDNNLNFDFRKRDFYCLKTVEKRCEHDEIMEKAWIYLGWEWISSI